jgi:transposase
MTRPTDRAARRSAALESAKAKLASGQAWSVDEAAAMLDCHPQTIREMCKRLRDPLPHTLIGREPRIWPAAFGIWKQATATN